MRNVKVRERMLARSTKTEQPAQVVEKPERDYTELDELPRREPMRPRGPFDDEIREDKRDPKRGRYIIHCDYCANTLYIEWRKGRRGAKKPKYKTHPNHRRLHHG